MDLKRFNPLTLLVLGYSGLSLMGALLLLLPFARNGPLSPIDALFTSTSALCVTGLIVKDTATFYTAFGKAVILLLIQLGGLGYMTFATTILFLLRRRGSLTLRLTMAESYPELTLGQVSHFVRRVFKLTLAFELVGAVLLAWAFSRYGLSPWTSVAHGVFISVSAFCNAGFSSFSDNLASFVTQPVVLVVVPFLFIAGGLGFFVHQDLYFRYLRRQKRKLELHTRVVLRMTGLLLLVGTAILYLAEGVRTSLPWIYQVLNAFFMAATPRTAGFNTLDVAGFTVPVVFLLLLLMTIGGSPGGTAGGIKTTTFAALFLWVRAWLRGNEKPVLLGNALPLESLQRSLIIVTMATSTILLGTWILTWTEGAVLREVGFLPLLFEVVSGFGTVGLSYGSAHLAHVSLSADFSALGKGVMIVIMLIGRIGVLSLAAWVFRREHQPLRYVEGSYIVG